MATVSVIVATVGRSAELEKLLASLQQQDFQDFEVLIVDQNVDERVADVVRSAAVSYPIRHIYIPGQRGVCRARNIGMNAAAGTYLLFPDDDCWYPPWFIRKGVELLSARDAACVSGRAADTDGRTINGRFETAPQWITRDNAWTTQIEWVVLFRADALKAVKGYDEMIGPGSGTSWGACEGNELILRLLACGHKAFFDPGLYGFHPELNTAHPDRGMILKGRAYARGFGHVLKLHGYRLPSLAYWLLRPAVAAGLALLKGNVARANYALNVAIGRLEGWTGRLVPRLSA
jgi:glycosyltransferase involved in cell wall biosynthesis